MHASECITGYARVLENVLNFPSDALLPGPTSILQQQAWEWNLFGRGIEEETGDLKNLKDGDFSFRSSAVYRLEQSFTSVVNPVNTYENETEVLPQDIPSKEDWDVLQEIEDFEEYERVEAEEVWCFLLLYDMRNVTLLYLIRCLVLFHIFISFH